MNFLSNWSCTASGSKCSLPLRASSLEVQGTISLIKMCVWAPEAVEFLSQLAVNGFSRTTREKRGLHFVGIGFSWGTREGSAANLCPFLPSP